jgi:hypothetical protein
VNDKERAPHRVLLVRQWDQQIGGSGCCGRLSSAAVESLQSTAEDPYACAREDMELIGRVYTALREEFRHDELDVTVVDPRNTVWLLPAIWRDGARRGLSVLSRLRQMSRATAPCTVVCDGLVVASDPTPAGAVSAVKADLARSRAA